MSILKIVVGLLLVLFGVRQCRWARKRRGRNRGAGLLAGLRDGMVSENASIVAVLSIVIAAKLLGDALVSLTS